MDMRSVPKRSASTIGSVNQERLTEATGLLVNLGGGSISLADLKWSLYLAERKSIIATNRPFFGGRYFAEELGPCLLDFKEMIHIEVCRPNSPHRWMRHFKIEEDQVTCVQRTDLENLSEKISKHLEASFHEITGLQGESAYNFFAKRCPEWKKNQGYSFGLKSI
jgi:hypothetical protein